jgi:hypothetical protein
MLGYEIQVAHPASQLQGGKPRLLPIRVRFHESVRPPLDILYPIQHALWDGEQDHARLLQELTPAIEKPSASVPRYVTPVGGALPLSDAFYIERHTEGRASFSLKVRGKWAKLRCSPGA